MTTPLFRHQLDAAIEAVEMARHAVQTMEEKRERMISEVNAIKSYYRTFIDLQAREIVRDQLLEGLQTFGNAMMEYGEMERHFDLYQQYLVNNTMYHLPASLLEHIKANKPKQGE